MSIIISQKYWYKVNFDLVWEKYRDTTFDLVTCKWFHIQHFPLPENWKYTSTNLLVMLPGLDGDIGYSKPDGFYVNKGLRTINNNITPHILENHIFNDRYKYNWARYSFHLKTWEPSSDGDSGDTLITLLEALTIGFFILADKTDNGVIYE